MVKNCNQVLTSTIRLYMVWMHLQVNKKRKPLEYIHLNFYFNVFLNRFVIIATPPPQGAISGIFFLIIFHHEMLMPQICCVFIYCMYICTFYINRRFSPPKNWYYLVENVRWFDAYLYSLANSPQHTHTRVFIEPLLCARHTIVKKGLILILVRHTHSKQTNKYITHPSTDFKNKKYKVHENVSVGILFYILKKPQYVACSTLLL